MRIRMDALFPVSADRLVRLYDPVAIVHSRFYICLDNGWHGIPFTPCREVSMRSRVNTIRLCLALVGMCVISVATTGVSAEAPTPVPTEAVNPAPVPERYRALYDSLKAGLDAANARLDLLTTSRPTPLTFAADLLPANGNRGQALLSPDALT